MQKKSARKVLNRKKIYIFIFLVINLLLLSLVFYKTKESTTLFPVFDINNAPEITEVSSKNNASFQELSTYFKNLALKKGAEYAFQVLGFAKLPPGTDLHLLGHVVGDILYKQEGSYGIKVCTDAFRNACSHSIVIGTLIEKGESSVPLLSKLCKSAPGGTGAYTMCFHGLGHGVLGYTGYNLEKAVKLCQKMGTAEYNNREIQECVGGTIMEMIAGIHDRTAWQRQVGNYFKKDNPLSPCNTDIIPAEAKNMCYTYLTPHLFELAGADLGNPNPSTFPKAFSFCSKLPLTDINRNDCYGGFGKDFIVLANYRDIRSVENMNKEKLTTVVEWCKMANDINGTDMCLQSALQSLFWGGENDPKAALSFCEILDGDYQKSCFNSLGGSINYYIKNPEYKKSLCNKIPAEFQKKCSQN